MTVAALTLPGWGLRVNQVLTRQVDNRFVKNISYPRPPGGRRVV